MSGKAHHISLMKTKKIPPHFSLMETKHNQGREHHINFIPLLQMGASALHGLHVSIDTWTIANEVVQGKVTADWSGLEPPRHMT